MICLFSFFNLFAQVEVNGGYELNKFTAPKIESKPFVFNDYSKLGSVNKLTGSFGINVSFYELKTPFLNIPIILSYSTNGVKMNEVSNEIGINWNLIGGGSITRKVNEFADDVWIGTSDFTKQTMYIQQNDLLPFDYYSSNLYPIDRPRFYYQNYSGSATNYGGTHYQIHFPRRLDHLNPITEETPLYSEIVCLAEKKCLQETSSYNNQVFQKYDTQPDIFTVNIANKSFKFLIKRLPQEYGTENTGYGHYANVINQKMEIVPIDDLGYKIEFSMYNLPGQNSSNGFYMKFKDRTRENNNLAPYFIHNFKIIDKEGVKYLFHKYEYTDYDVLKQHFNAYQSDINVPGKIYIDYKEYMTDMNKWYLTKIELPNGEEINYDYVPNEYLYQKDLPRTHDGVYTGHPYNFNPIKTPYGIDWLDVHVEGFSLSEIRYNSQKIKFYYDSYRPDYKTGGLSLKKIELLYNDELVKRMDLIKSFEAFDYEGPSFYRMFLKEIQDSSLSDSYVFDYNNPEMNRRDHVRYQDLFGYYLGNSINTFPSFPTIYISPDNLDGNKISYEIPSSANYFVINGTNRNPNPTYTKSGTLNKISFPTGGFVEIDYENNTYYDERLASKKSLGPGVRVKNLKYFSDEGIQSKKVNYYYDQFNDSTFSSGKLLYKPSYAYVSNWALDNSFNRASNELTPLLDRMQLSDQLTYWNKQLYENFKTYEMLNNSSLSLEEKYKKLIRFSSYPIGPTFDIYGRELIYTNVREEIVDVNNIRNGYNKSYFKYIDNRVKVNSVGGPSDEPSEFAKGSPGLFVFSTEYYSYYPFGGIPSSSGYDYLKTRSGLIEKNGYEIYPFPERNYFSNKENATLGKLNKEEYYDNNDVLLMEENYEYDFIMKESQNVNLLKNIKTGYLKLHQYKNNDPAETFHKQIVVPPYNVYDSDKHNFSGHYFFSIDSLRFNTKVVLKSKEVKKYFDAGGNTFISDEINYEYDNYTGNLKKKISYRSNSDVIEIKYDYPNTDSGDYFLDSLANSNMISKPYYKEIKVNNVLTENTEFKYFIHSSGMVLPSKLKKFKKGSISTGIGEDIFLFKSYNNGGLLQEYSEPSGLNTVLIYGYNENEIIAKIENANFIDVQPYIPNLQTLSNGTNESSLIASLNNLRSSLPNAMVTTYTYKPLVGVSSITDPKGNTITYHYDGFGRLEFVKDKDGNILSENEYHYRTQN